jgi:hypothetical protein
MKTITVELTAEMAEQLLPIWEQQRDQKEGELAELKSRINHVREALSDTTASGGSFTVVQPIVPAAKTAKGRTKRGESKKLIKQFLKMRNGVGATIKEITAETGTAYGTVRRILIQLEGEHSAERHKGLWKLMS